MILKIFLVYLIGFIGTILIRVVDAKIEMIKIKSREAKEEIVKFSLLWLPGWILVSLFVALDKLEKGRAKKALKAED